MRRLKSVVFLAVIAMMMFGLVAVANAAVFSDIAGNPASVDIVQLKALGVVNGYPDGTFQPTGSITRAEFSKIAVGVAGFKDMGDALKGTSKFSDVSPDAWYAGWVNLAASQGYVLGYPDGTFQPEASITSAEVITQLLRILGYDDRLVGDWPTDYLAKAKSLGITDDLTFIANAPASRALVCQLASAALEENVVYWDNDKGKFVDDTNSDDESYTLIDDVFEGAVESDALIADYKLNNDKLEVLVKNWNDEEDAYEDGEWVELSENAVFDGAASVHGLEGVIVDYVMDTDEDELLFAGVKAYGTLLDDEATFSDVDSDDVDADGTADEGDVTSFDVEVNDEDYSTAAGVFILYFPVDGTMEGYYPFKFVLNQDGDIAFAKRTAYKELQVIDEIKVSSNKIEFVDGSSLTLDEDDDNVIIKGGAAIGIGDLAVGDGLWDYTNNKGYDNRVIFQTKTAAGELNRYAEDDYVTVGGTQYDICPGGIVAFDDENDEVDDIADLLGNDVNIYMNGLGQVQVITGTVGESNRTYGIVMDADIDDSRGVDSAWLKLFTKDGQEVTYDCEEDFQSGDTSDEWDIVYDNGEVAGGSAYEGTLVSITLNSDGDIDSIEEPDYTDAGLADYTIANVNKDYNKLMVGGSYRYDRTETVIVDYNDTEEPDLVTWADVEDSDEITDARVYYDGSDIEWIVIGGGLGVSDELDRAIYLGYYDNGDDLMAELFVNGAVVEYTIDSAAVVAAVDTDSVVEFDLDGDEAITITTLASEEDADYDDVTDVNYSDNVIEIGGVEYQVDSDTQIIDYTGDAPKVITLDEIADGDNVLFVEYADTDKDGVLAIIVMLDLED